MIAPELIRNLYIYYSRFVSSETIKKQAVVPAAHKSLGYDELLSEMLNHSGKAVISEFQRYIFSINDEFVSDGVRNGNGYLLWVEYGELDIDKNLAEQYPASVQLRICVAREYAKANRDMVEEVLVMQKTLDLLNRVIDRLMIDQRNPDSCGNPVRLAFPCKIVPLDPAAFYDHAGWIAMFNHEEVEV